MTGDSVTTTDDSSGILPAQTSVGARWNGDTSGPRALMLAVLEDALQCIERGRRRRTFHARRLAGDAEAWVRSDRRDWPFSFVNICEVLGFEADAFRKRLLTTRNATSDARRVRLRVPIRARALTVASEPPRVSAGGMR